MKLEDSQVVLSFVLSFISIFIFFGLSFADTYPKIEIKGLKSMSREEFLYLMDLKESTPINLDKISEGIKRVFLKEFFEDIVIEREDERLYILVKEKPVIQSIRIDGNNFFDHKFYRKLLNFKTNERLKEINLKKSIENIIEHLKKRGFHKADLNIKKDCFEDKCDIILQINEGMPKIIKKIHWINRDAEEIKNLIDLNEGEPFDQIKIQEFIEKAKKYFKRRGFVGTEIKYNFENDELFIKVERGNLLEIELLGDLQISKKDLLKIINAHFQDRIDENIIRDSINSLIFFYRINGFIDAKIYPIVEEVSEESLIKIYYVINEGSRKYVEETNLIFSNEVSRIDLNEINKIIANSNGSPFNPEELDNDRKKIEEYLKKMGYYFAKVFSTEIIEEKNRVRILFKINEGEKLKIKNINIAVKDDILKDEAREKVKVYIENFFNDSVLLEIKRKLLETYQSAGYADVIINEKIEIVNQEVDIQISIEPGKIRYFGKSIILGNKRTKTQFIYDRLSKKDNQNYNPYVLEQDRQTLYRTGLFSRVDISFQKSDESLDVIYNLEESPAGAFEFGLGYGEYERAKGFIELSYINLFGLNKQIFSRIEVSKIDKRTYLTYIDPWLVGDLIFKSSITYEEFEAKNIDTKAILYKLRRLSFSAGFEKKILEQFKMELLYEGVYSKTWDVLPEIVLSNLDIGSVLISGLKASVIYDSRDNPFDPKKGWLSGISSKISSEFFGSELNFLKTSLYLNKYTELFNGFVLATSLRAGWIWLYGNTKDVPISERYFLGGRESVRGYAFNTLGPKKDNQPTGGNAFLMGNLELRTYLGKNFSLVNFLDVGNVWKKAWDINLAKLKYTTGIGLRYKTPVGPIRIDYGYKLNREREESRGEIHFSIGHAF